MLTNIITVKDVQEKSRDGSTWLELIDQKDRTHRIFRRVQDNEGNWHDLSSKYDMLRNSQNRTLKLTTEQKGRFTNVVDVETVENVFTQEAQRSTDNKEQECRLRTFTTAYAKDLAVAGKISMDDILGWSEILYRYLQGEITIGDEEINNIMKKTAPAEEEAAKAPTRRIPTSRTLEGVTR